MEDEKKSKVHLIEELKAMRLQSAKLGKRAYPDSERVEEDLQQQAHKLAERDKELDCLYGISNLIETPDISIDGILRGAVELLPRAWQYPSLACARIVLRDQTCKTPDFEESAWRLASDIKVQGEVTGMVEVFYMREPPPNGKEPFLPEEVKLLDAVAKRLGRVTERKQAERRQYLTAEILGILNDPSILAVSIDLILAAIKRETGFDAVGIRLRSGDDFPYFVQNGFPQDFLLTENTLISRDASGGLCRDKNGNISLECTCGLVISGQTDPTNPLFTVGGSCWTNNSLTFLDLPAEQDPRLHPRNKCIHQGYLSVALIPIRADREIVGLLQLNDRRKDCFTLEIIHFFERISASIGVALMRKQAAGALRESEKGYRELSIKLQDAYLWMSQKKDKIEARKYSESIIFLTADDGRICGFTEEAAGMTKKSHSDLQGCNIQDIFVFQEGQTFMDLIHKARPRMSYLTTLRFKRQLEDGPVYEAKLTRIVVESRRLFFIVLYH
jgi:GAF domain-containing protein